MSSSNRTGWGQHNSRAEPGGPQEMAGGGGGGGSKPWHAGPGEPSASKRHDPIDGYTSTAPLAHANVFGSSGGGGGGSSSHDDRTANGMPGIASMRRHNTVEHRSDAARHQQQYEPGPSSQRLESGAAGSGGPQRGRAGEAGERPRTSPTKMDDVGMGMDEAHGDGRAAGKERPSTGGGKQERWTSSTAAVSSESRGGEAAAARKQNTACDACRTRKVRCLRTPGEEKCNHCRAKAIDCTTIYVQLATSGVKRPIKRIRGEAGENEVGAGSGEEVTGILRYLFVRDAEYTTNVFGVSFAENRARRTVPSTPAEARLANSTAREEFVSSLLETYFSTVHIRYPIVDPQEFLQRFHYRSPELGGAPSDVLVAVLLAWGAKFSKHPIIVADRRETATEEMTASQRLKRSITNPHSAQTGTTDGGGRGATSAAAGEGGSRERPSSGSDAHDRVMGRSRIADTLAVKAQEVLDRNKAHRIATMDNAKAAIITQALFWQLADQCDISDVRPSKRKSVYICSGTWINSAILQMTEMKVHLKETLESIADPSHRGQMAMSWWLACMFDAHMSAFYRRKPLLSAEDYSTQPPLPPPSNPEAGPSPMASEQGYRIWLNSALDQCEMMRSVYFTLWTPAAEEVGVSARKLESLLTRAYDWRDRHLALVGAPDPDWPSTWRFADAVTACSSDINFQIVWILIWQAVDEFGIAELKCNTVAALNAVASRHGLQSDAALTPAQLDLDRSKINGMRSAIYDQALSASLRCADLSRMLCDFDYLQNEAGIMKFALYEAGYLLTRFRRVEVYKIIDGLRQYGQAFEECYEQADELERLASEYSQPVGGRGQQGVYTYPQDEPRSSSSAGYGSHGPGSSSSAAAAATGAMRYDSATAHREKRSSGMVGPSSPQNILPEVGTLMIANLGQDPNHPGMHHFAHHLMQRGMPVQQHSYGPSPPPTSHASSRMKQGGGGQPAGGKQQQSGGGGPVTYGASQPMGYTQGGGGGGKQHMQPANSPPSYGYGGGGPGIQPSSANSGRPGSSAGNFSYY